MGAAKLRSVPLREAGFTSIRACMIEMPAQLNGPYVVLWFKIIEVFLSFMEGNKICKKTRLMRLVSDIKIRARVKASKGDPWIHKFHQGQNPVHPEPAKLAQRFPSEFSLFVSVSVEYEK